jgi:hypothetical protein
MIGNNAWPSIREVCRYIDTWDTPMNIRRAETVFYITLDFVDMSQKV